MLKKTVILREINGKFGFKHEQLRVSLVYGQAADLCLRIARGYHRENKFTGAYDAYMKAKSLFGLQLDALSKANLNGDTPNPISKYAERAKQLVDICLQRVDEVKKEI